MCVFSSLTWQITAHIDEWPSKEQYMAGAPSIATLNVVDVSDVKYRGSGKFELATTTDPKGEKVEFTVSVSCLSLWVVNLSQHPLGVWGDECQSFAPGINRLTQMQSPSSLSCRLHAFDRSSSA